MDQKNINLFILTGEPGVGKTTITKKICSILSEKGIKTAGFYTEEVRKNRIRVGFDVVSLAGKRGRLAIEDSILCEPTKYKVGKYSILVEEFEQIALPSLDVVSDDQTCLIIDEMGKMELFSKSFRLKMRDILKSTSNIVLLTLPLKGRDPSVDSFRNKMNSKVWVVTKANRNTIHNDILNEMLKVFKQ